MSNIFALIARARHWHLFVMFVLPFCALPFVLNPDLASDPQLASFGRDFTILMLFSSPSFILAYLWIWAAGVLANAHLDERLQRKTTLLQFSIPYAIGYLLFAIWAWPNSIKASDPVIPVGFVLTAHILAVLLLFYAVIFAARSIGSIGRANLSGFGRTLLFLLGFIYYPIGVWFIQPRLNAIME